MQHYPRKPSILILALGVLTGLGLVSAWGRFSDDSAANGQSVEALQAAIASNPTDAGAWFNYGQRLRRDQKFGPAATAFRKVLEIEPYHREARIFAATTLAQAGERDELRAYMGELILSNAKMAVDLFDRPELQPYLADPHFLAMQKDARGQALD